jgi:hypothetical protein
VTEVAGALQSRLGPLSRSYFVAKRVVTTLSAGQFERGQHLRLRAQAQAR